MMLLYSHHVELRDLCSGYLRKEATFISIVLPFDYHGFAHFSVHLKNSTCIVDFFIYLDVVKSFKVRGYSSLPNKRTCTPYLILTKLPPCTLLFGTASLSIFWIFVKYSGLIWIFFGKN